MNDARPDPSRQTSRRMLGRLLAAIALPLALPVVLWSLPAAAQPQPPLPAVQLQAGIHLIRAEVAADHETRMRGLMFRERLGPNQGMLFVFEARSGQCFWMRNTLIPLTIAFIDDDGSIVNLADMQPRTEDSHCSAKPVRFALEMEQGWFARRGLKAGARIDGPPGMFAPRK